MFTFIFVSSTIRIALRRTTGSINGNMWYESPRPIRKKKVMTVVKSALENYSW